ncbi:MAG: hypothetical protein JO061_19935, partial [Acidobacteriaceae bacterium]|nr:hypothetical protein [Acidobacteriaceae bacterium]
MATLVTSVPESAKMIPNRSPQDFILAVIALLDRIGRWRRSVVLGLFVAVILVRLALLHFIPIPHAWVDDEFSYLLGADTFASGRLTNPTPAAWRSFEALHIILQPTYASKYQPGQAALLALGQVLFGHPYWGVVLETALFCAAMCWVLQVLASPAWALLGGLLTCAIFGTTHYWMESYWGGSLTALGACLVVGAAFRIMRKVRPERYALPLAIGSAILFFTRPFEGFALLAGVALVLGPWIWRARRDLNMRRLALPVLLVFLCTIGFQAYYDLRITGSASTLPYQVHERAYAVVPTFWFLPLNSNVQPPSDPVLYTNHWGMEMYDYKQIHSQGTWRRFNALLLRSLVYVPLLFGGLAGALWLIPVFWSDWRIRALSVMTIPVTVSTMLLVWSHEHYMATALPGITALLMVVLQKIRGLRLGPGTGRRAGTLLTGLALVFLAVTIYLRRPSPSLAQRDITAPNPRHEDVMDHIFKAAKDRDDLI